MLSIESRKQRWIDFMDLRSRVNRMAVLTCQEGAPERPLLWWDKQTERIDWSYAAYQQKLRCMELYDDHSVPFLSLITGTEIFAEALGCRVYKPLDNNPFALPMVRTAAEAARIKIPRLEDTQLMRLFEMGALLRQKAGQSALLSLPDIQTPADIAALIWEKSEFYAAMIEEPDAVRELIEKVRVFQFEFLDRWFETFGREFVAHYPDYYMPYGITVSEDEIGVVSAALYRDFFEEDLRLLSERYGQIGIHSCADSKHQWDNLKNVPNLKLVNLHRNRTETLESLSRFSRVCAQMPADGGADPDTLPEAESIHSAVFTTVSTIDEAKACMRAFYEKYPYLKP